MSRFGDRIKLAGLWTAQESRKNMREGDPLFASKGGDRFVSGAVVNTDAQHHVPPRELPPRPHKPAASVPARAYSLVSLCRAMHLPEPVPEHPVCTYRKWRFDYAWPRHMLALEVEGGIWTQGRHTRGAGALADLEKYSEAAINGWRVIYCTPDDLFTLGIDRARKALAMTRQAA